MSVTGYSTDPFTEDECISELDQPIWSVISFDKREAARLSYKAAFHKLDELEREGIAGLCVVTDNAAENIERLEV